MAGRLVGIYLKRVRRGPMDPVPSATLVAGRGLVGNANQGGRRQVTILERERWEDACAALGIELEPSARRANLVVENFPLADSRDRVLRVGAARLRVRGETKPCERMDEAAPGLQAQLRPAWRGGVFAEVLEDAEIAVGDALTWEPEGDAQ